MLLKTKSLDISRVQNMHLMITLKELSAFNYSFNSSPTSTCTVQHIKTSLILVLLLQTIAHIVAFVSRNSLHLPAPPFSTTQSPESSNWNAISTRNLAYFVLLFHHHHYTKPGQSYRLDSYHHLAPALRTHQTTMSYLLVFILL